jgi:beta-glucanase (GH16 family)
VLGASLLWLAAGFAAGWVTALVTHGIDPMAAPRAPLNARPAGTPAPNPAPTAARSPVASPSAGTRDSAALTPTIPKPAATPTSAASGWVETFLEDFNGATLDPTKWNIGSHWRGSELYVPDNVRIQDGRLRLESRRQTYSSQGRSFDYTSGYVDTRGKFSQLYGRFEVRARLPKGNGIWPAHWLMPQDGSTRPEIDIMELLGGYPSTVHMSNHWGTAEKPEDVTRSFTGPNFSTDFHTFTLEWEPGQLRWLVDGILRVTTTDGVPTVPMYLILNTQIGGDWPGFPDGTTVFPQFHEIEYVRVYRRVPAGGKFPLTP